MAPNSVKVCRTSSTRILSRVWRMADSPDRDTPCGHGRFVDDGDGRLFRHVRKLMTSNARSDRGGCASGRTLEGRPSGDFEEFRRL